ncbi:MAG: pseudouridine-5'-phosphate glycosidase [Anaerolineae bacterium]|nr:pseudouridine-5'-phosphate glycosidase [Anaerolineae bacterium]
MMTIPFINPKVVSAVKDNQPLVALETALVTHGFAYPDNLEITQSMIDVIEHTKVTAAVVGVFQGIPTVGLDRNQLAELAVDRAAFKISLRDLPLSRIRSGHGGTTVAATAWLAHRAGIHVFATGGIGGVHRGHPEDVSADLPILASTPVIVVCAGAKSILDLPRTLEYLETAGVPILGWDTESFPAFYSRNSGLPVDIKVNQASEVADIFRQQRATGLPQGLLVTVPVPETAAIPNQDIEPLIAAAVREADKHGIYGKSLTPYLLSILVNLSDKRTKNANESLLIRNAQVASQIALALV